MSKCGIEMKIENLMIDFEAAMIRAVKRILPNTTLMCCRFHLGQNWLKAITRLGLLTTFYNFKNNPTGLWLKKVFGFSAIDHEHIQENFAEFLKSAPEDSRVDSFVKYLKRFYMTVKSTYPPALWGSAITTTLQTTNNGPEALHRVMNAFIEKSHPNIFVFIEELENLHVFDKINANSVKVKPEGRLAGHRDDHRALLSGEITIDQFLTRVLASKHCLPAQI